VEFNSIEHALALQDEDDREDMQLLGKSKQIKGPDAKGLTPRYFNTLGLDAQDNSTPMKLHHDISPLKAKENVLKGARISVGRAGTVVTKESLKSKLQAAIDYPEDAIKGISSQDVIIKAGPVEMKKDCLTCTGAPSHAIEMFKMACISYKPS